MIFCGTGERAVDCFRQLSFVAKKHVEHQPAFVGIDRVLLFVLTIKQVVLPFLPRSA